MLSEIMNTPEDGSKLAWVTASSDAPPNRTEQDPNLKWNQRAWNWKKISTEFKNWI